MYINIIFNQHFEHQTHKNIQKFSHNINFYFIFHYLHYNFYPKKISFHIQSKIPFDVSHLTIAASSGSHALCRSVCHCCPSPQNLDCCHFQIVLWSFGTIWEGKIVRMFRGIVLTLCSRGWSLWIYRRFSRLYSSEPPEHTQFRANSEKATASLRANWNNPVWQGPYIFDCPYKHIFFYEYKIARRSASAKFTNCASS